jgi:hypothetical protein
MFVSEFINSCSPNAAIYWDITTLSARLRALYPIPSGTQITIGYTSCCVPRLDRRKRLRSMYNFTCSCSSCALPDAKSAMSDHNRRQIKFLKGRIDVSNEERLKQWLKDPNRSDHDMIRTYEQVWELMEAEQCHVRDVLTTVVQSLCKIYCALGNLEEAKKWALRGMTNSLIYANDEGDWRAVYEAPQRTAWWCLRKAFRK